jgi:hypothetical protein
MVHTFERWETLHTFSLIIDRYLDSQALTSAAVPHYQLSHSFNSGSASLASTVMNLISKPLVLPKKPNLPHRTSIATVCVSGQLLDKLTAIAEAGFDGVEIFENDLLHYPGSRQDIYNVCQELGLKIEMYQPFRDLEGAPNPEELKRSLDRLERKFQWMDELHTDLILLCSNCSPSSVSAPDYL